MNTNRLLHVRAGLQAGSAVHALLAVLKMVVGVAVASPVLVADALRSGVAAAAAFSTWAQMKARAGRKRSVTSFASWRRSEQHMLLLGFLLAGLALLLGLNTASSWKSVPLQTPSTVAVMLAVLLAVLQLLFLRRFYNRLDSVASLLLLAGAAGMTAGRLLGVQELYWCGPVATVGICCLVIARFYALAAAPLGGSARSMVAQEELELRALVARVSGVIAVEALHAQEHEHLLLVTGSIRVNPAITVQEGHEIAKKAEAILLGRCPRVLEVRLSVMPYDLGYPYKSSAGSKEEQSASLLQ